MNKKYIYLAIIFILSLFIGGKWNIPLAAWIVPIFGIRFFRDSDKAGRNFLLLWLVSAVSTIISWQGATFMSKIHPLAEAGFFLLMAPIGLLPYIIDRIYFRRFGSSAWLTLVYPIAATAMDFFSATGSPFGTFGAGAYSQRDFLPTMQIVSVTGLWGVTFVASWLGSLVNHFWEVKPARLSLTFGGVLALILALSFGRTLLPSQPQHTAQIAGFSLPAGKLSEVMSQLNSNNNEAGFRQLVDELHADELNQIRKMADEGANIVALQEGAGMGMSDQVEKLIANTSEIAKEKNIYIVLPTFDFGKTPAENIVRIIDPNGAVVLTHVKFGGNDFEGSLKGDGVLQTVDTPYGKLSAIICWDADFPNAVKQAGEQNVDLLFVPSNDWLEVKDIHAGYGSFPRRGEWNEHLPPNGTGRFVSVGCLRTRSQPRGHVRRKRKRFHWHSKCANTDWFCEHAVSLGWRWYRQCDAARIGRVVDRVVGDQKKTVDRRPWMVARSIAYCPSSTVRYNRHMTDEPLRTLQFLLSRLERISADSAVAYRASGVRGAILRVVEKLEEDKPVSGQDVKRLTDRAYLLLQKAAREKIR